MDQLFSSPPHTLPLGTLFHERVVERMAEPLRVLHSPKGQLFLVAGVCHMTAERAYKALGAIDRDPCGAPHHMMMPRGQSARCSASIQQNTLSCAHGSQLPLQQALVAATLLKAIGPDILQDYVRIRTIQKEVLLQADNLLTSAYAIAARSKEDEASQAHMQRMSLPVVGAKPADVCGWMQEKQQATAAPLLTIIDAVIAGLEERFPALRTAAGPSKIVMVSGVEP